MRFARYLLALVAVLMVSLSALGASPAAVHASTVPPPPIRTHAPAVEPVFNQPVYGFSPLDDLERQLIDGTSTAHGPVTISATFYHLADRRLANDLLVASLASDVHVHVLLDGSNRTLGCKDRQYCVNPAFAELGDLNNESDPDDWMRTCDGIGKANPYPVRGAGAGCVGAVRNHNKFLLISRTNVGGEQDATDVVFQTSANSTPTANHTAFNDGLLTQGIPSLYDDYLSYFTKIANDYAKTSQPSIPAFDTTFGYRTDTTTIGTGKISTWSYPRIPGNDPVVNILDQIPTRDHCANHGRTPGSPKRTHVAMAMSHINGRTAVIRRLATLRLSGCAVTMVYTTIGKRDRAMLLEAGVGLVPLCIVNPQDPEGPPVYNHSKYLLIEGTQRGVGADRLITYTGSSNLTDQALRSSDDRLMRYVETRKNDTVFYSYASEFGNMLAAATKYPASPVRCDADAGD